MLLCFFGWLVFMAGGFWAILIGAPSNSVSIVFSSALVFFGTLIYIPLAAHECIQEKLNFYHRAQ